MEALLQATPPSKPAVVVSVGCNKAYDFIRSVREWSRDDKFSVSKLLEAHVRNNLRGRRVVFGACGSARKGDSPIKDAGHGIRNTSAWCFEPLGANMELLNKSFNMLGYLSDPRVHLVQAAISSHKAQAYFPRSSAGAEVFGIQKLVADQATATPAKAGADIVDVVTLDDTLPADLQEIDFLSIDTEGNDMRVIFGSMKLLSTIKVRYMEFEYHQVGHWAHSDLGDLADLLDQFGFDCYIPGNGGQLWRLTGCWHDSYYRRTWSNVACVNREESEVHRVMEEIASQYEMKK